MTKTITGAMVFVILVHSAAAGLRTDLLKRDARNGKEKAQYELALAYERGDGVPRDQAQAFSWYKQAAEQNHREAQLALALCYAEGRGTELDDDEAFNWAMKAAKQSSDQAQYYVGLCYEKGLCGQKVNQKQALRWIRQSASQGYADAQFSLASYYQDGFGVAADMRKAAGWYLKAAEKGNKDACLVIAHNFDRWKSYFSNKDAALRQLKTAAEQGDARSQYSLGMHLKTNSSEEDLKTSVTWLKLAVRQGYAPATQALADSLLKGIGIEKDVQKAAQFYSLSVNVNDPACQMTIAEIYAGEYGGEPDLKCSAEWYLKAAKRGYLDAQIKCIFNYGKGIGVKADRVETYAWALIVSGQGKHTYKQNLEGILSVEEKTKAYRRSRALRSEIMALKK